METAIAVHVILQENGINKRMDTEVKEHEDHRH